MFLKYCKSKINSQRNKKKIVGFLSNINYNLCPKTFFRFRIKNKHKFLNNSNSIIKCNFFKNNLIKSYIISKWFKINYGNFFLVSCFYSNLSFSIKPASYGINFKKIYNNYFSSCFVKYNKTIPLSNKLLKFIDVMYYNFCVFFCRNSIVYNLRDYFSSKIFAKSAGTFCSLLFFNKISKLFFVKLPSKKRYYFDFFIVAFLGRSSNIFSKYSFFSSFKQKFLIKKHNPKVRGIAKNPFDHPNGGSSKTKRPLKTPWAKIAKKGK